MEINKLKSTTAKKVFSVGLAVSLLLGSAACVPIDSMIITPTPETSPLPSDVTPELSPTEALVELTPKVTKTPVPTAKATEMLIITLTRQPTAIETEALEDRHIFLTEKIGYGGYQFDFEISLLNDDEIIKAAFEKYGIESVSINEEKINGRELMAKTLIYSFVETYNIQNGTNVSMDEYMANPTNFPTMINMLGENGKQQVQSVTIDKIKNIELRYTSGMDGELYMNLPNQLIIPSGYSLDNDKFTVYTFLSTRDPEIEAILKEPEEIFGDALPYIYGYYAFSSRFINALSLLPISSIPTPNLEEIAGGLTNVQNISETKFPGRMSTEVFNTWIKERGTLFTINSK